VPLLAGEYDVGRVEQQLRGHCRPVGDDRAGLRTSRGRARADL